MPAPDTVAIELAKLTSQENRDRVAQIERLMRQILYSLEVSPSCDEDGEYTLDHHYVMEPATITMRKAKRPAHRPV